MQDVLLMGCLHSLGNLAGNNDHVFQRDRPSLLDKSRQTSAREVIHDNVGPSHLRQIGIIAISYSDDGCVMQFPKNVGLSKYIINTSVKANVMEGLDHNLRFLKTVKTTKSCTESARSQDAFR